MARNTRPAARRTSGATAATPSSLSSKPARGRGRPRRAAGAPRGRGGAHTSTSTKISSPSSSASSSSAAGLSPPASPTLSSQAADLTAPTATVNSTSSSSTASPSSSTSLSSTSPSSTPGHTVSPLAHEVVEPNTGSATPSHNLPTSPSPVSNIATSPRATQKRTRRGQSALKGTNDRVSGARVSKSVRFISKPTSEFPPPEVVEDDSPEDNFSSKPDGFFYRERHGATGYQPGGTRRFVFNYNSEVTGSQGALHHQTLFKVGLGGGRFKPGKGTLPRRSQVVLYLKEDLNLEGLPQSLGIVFHKVAADSFMPVITVKGDAAAITAPLPSTVKRFDPEDPDA